MIQEFDDNEVFSTDYLNIAPKAGDLAAIYERDGRNLLMSRDENDVADSAGGSALFQNIGSTRMIRSRSESRGSGRTAGLSLYTQRGELLHLHLSGEGGSGFSFLQGMEYLPFSFENRPLPQKVYFGAETAFQLSNWYNDNKGAGAAAENDKCTRRCAASGARPAAIWCFRA